MNEGLVRGAPAPSEAAAFLTGILSSSCNVIITFVFLVRMDVWFSQIRCLPD